MKNRNILSGIMFLHEILHETKKRNEIGVILKIDFEKAYDKVNWNLLFKCLEIRGLGEKWCEWIKQVVSGGIVSVKINNQICPYIKSFKGVRQGDPLSPNLFNFVADCLTRIVHKAQLNGLLTGLISHIVPNGVAIQQYADDTIIFLKHDFEGAAHMKILIFLFEKLAGLTINFNKSEIYMINDEGDWGQAYAELFNCQIGFSPSNIWVYLLAQVG